MCKFHRNGAKIEKPQKIKPLHKGIMPALLAVESLMGFLAPCTKCRTKKTSNLNLDPSTNLKVNNINPKVAWSNTKKNNRIRKNKNKKVMMIRLYMRVLIFKLILNNWWVPRKKTKRRIEEWIYLMIMGWLELIYRVICRHFNRIRWKLMLAKKPIIHHKKNKTICPATFFTQTLFKIQLHSLKMKKLQKRTQTL